MARPTAFRRIPRNAIAFASMATEAVAGTRRRRGTLVVYGELGYTTAGPLRVRPGGITVPDDALISTDERVPLVREHDPAVERGGLFAFHDTDERLVVEVEFDETPEGDKGLAEATGPERTRAGLSYYIEDIVLDDEGWVASSRLVHIGQVEDPAYNSSRLEQIAASRTHLPPGTSRANEGEPMTPEQIARLAELRARTDALTPEEQAELDELANLALDQVTAPAAAVTDPADPVDPATLVTDPDPAPAAPAAPAAASRTSVPAVPAGNPAVAAAGNASASSSSQPRGENAFEKMISALAQSFEVKKAGGNALPGIQAALSEIDGSTHTSTVEPLGWSGLLFDGVAYDPVFSPNFATAPLDHWEGKGYRIDSTPRMADYAGDNTEIPTGNVVTSDQLWEAARAAVGFRIDEKYLDFPNADFLAAIFQAVGESWVELVDDKCGLYTLAEAVEVSRPVTVNLATGDATVTAANGAVTAADIGSSIIADGIPAGAKVLSITNGTTFEITQNATATGAISADVGVRSASLLKAAARLALTMKRRYRGHKAVTGTGPEYIHVNDEDWFKMLDITQFELPAYLKAYGIDPETFKPSEEIAPGALIGGVKRAANLRTESRSPIIVDALALATGSIDKSFRGYWAIEKVLKRGIQKAAYSTVVEA